jgi:hypothetical protein
MLSPKDQLTICFAHVAYRLRERFAFIRPDTSARSEARIVGVVPCALAAALL